ncbi:MAG: bifunctional 4-hydroxy-2-oxoglutarate aldolase/2-dehydro-3-deoxy-phosphogluconate aldolase [Elainellaceae cyanobacterium]
MEPTPLREAWLRQLRQHRAIAVIRAPDLEQGYRMAVAVAAGGVHLIEIAWTTPQAALLIGKLRAELPDCCIGAGTLLTLDAVHSAVDAGAQFLFSPHTNTVLIQAACRRQRPMIPGALSPSEIVAAWQAGAASVKVFPFSALGGVSYIRALQGPLGHISLVPTGGVTLDLAAPLLEAGAAAVGLSTALFPQAVLEAQAWEAVTQRATGLTDKLKAYLGRG